MSDVIYPCDTCCEVRTPGAINTEPTEEDLDVAGCEARGICHYWQLRTTLAKQNKELKRLQKIVGNRANYSDEEFSEVDK